MNRKVEQGDFKKSVVEAGETQEVAKQIEAGQ